MVASRNASAVLNFCAAPHWLHCQGGQAACCRGVELKNYYLSAISSPLRPTAARRERACPFRSLSKNQSHSLSYSRISFKKEENGSEKRIDKTLLPLPGGQLFQIHGCKLKLHPVRYLGQASVLCITHSVFFFGVCKDAFNGLFPLLVKILVLRCIAGIVCQLFVILPDMPLYGFYAVFGVGAKLSGGTICANLGIAFVFPVAVPVCGGIYGASCRQNRQQWSLFREMSSLPCRTPRQRQRCRGHFRALPLSQARNRGCHRPYGPHTQTAAHGCPLQRDHSPGRSRSG